MACFITPLLTGILVSVARKLKKDVFAPEVDMLRYMLIGGSLVLAVEHALNGEITPYPPFLTAATSPGGLSLLFREVAIVGGSMTGTVLLLWMGLTWLIRKQAVSLAVYSKKTSTTLGRG